MPSGFNFRRFLSGQPAEDPLDRLAELGRETDSATPTHPAWRIPELATRDEALPTSLVEEDKKVVDVFAAESKKEIGRRRAPSYVWRSQAGRESRSSAIDFANRTF